MRDFIRSVQFHVLCFATTKDVLIESDLVEITLDVSVFFYLNEENTAADLVESLFEVVSKAVLMPSTN